MMIAISLMIEGQDGLTWPRWQRLVAEVEDLGFAGLFRSDHFTNSQPPDRDSLELIVSLAYLADHSQRVHFGPLVAPLSFRHPTLLARQAAALDDLSGGRMILGLGAGWQEREHRLFGHDLGDVPTRMARLTEGLEVITRLLGSDEPTSFAGRFYQLNDAQLLPRPQRPSGPPILIGGNGRKYTLPLVARFAQIWNGLALSPAAFRERSDALDELLRAAGRSPGDVRRTLMASLVYGRDASELEREVSELRKRNAAWADLPLDALLALLRDERNVIAGPPDMIVEQIGGYAAAGVEELMLQWFALDDIDGLRGFAKQVLARL
jgi:F420-dependent oxidoreductase-like protein